MPLPFHIPSFLVPATYFIDITCGVILRGASIGAGVCFSLLGAFRRRSLLPLEPHRVVLSKAKSITAIYAGV